ncbi:MAG TPA: glycosyltransferase family 39 protein [Candidatus Acidoferrum sp.]|nr:glycosyltransferase family 39 protein [Candidatus Acidoferrum sp.]
MADYFGLSYPHEFISAALLLVALILLRAITIAHYKFGDESQHLHVIWGWARGFVQYRDLADNHMPLFHILWAPIYRLIGDCGTILYWMRIVSQPLYIVAFWCTYRIGSLLFSRRVGVWAAILVGLSIDYAFCSVEFRTDNLWATLWLLCMWVLLNGALTMRRALIAGFLMGLCFGVSMKTLLLAMSILVGGSATLIFVGRERLGIGWGQILGALAAFFASALIVPATIVGAFALYGIWPQFRYWVFDHNVVPGLTNHPGWWVIIFVVGFPLVILGARRIVAATPEAGMAARRSFVFVTAGFFITALVSFWPFLSRQDYLPFYPLAFVIGTGAVLTISDRWARNRNIAKIWRVVPLPALVGVCELLVAFLAHPFWENNAKLESDLLRTTLKLTEPGDFVFDRRGETVFRQRCFYPIIETFTEERIRRGLMADNVIQRCIDTHTCVAILPDKMPPATFRFVEQNYLPIGNRLRVAGVLLQSSTDGKPFEFQIVIPASYKIIARDVGTVTGMLDGQRYEGKERFLSRGIHTFVQTSTGHDLVVFWAQAVDRHFRPIESNRSPGS